MPEALSAEKEKRSPFYDRSSDCTPELIEQVAWLVFFASCVEERSRIKSLVAVVLIERPVELLGTGIGNDADYPSPRSSILGRVHVCLYAKLLNGVQSGGRNQLVVIRVGARGAVEIVAVISRSSSIESNRESLAIDGAPFRVT